MKCKICQSESKEFAQAKILQEYSARYYLCGQCGFLQVEEPFWLKEAYEEPINVYDTGNLARNMDYSKVTATLIYFLFKKDGKFLDYAGGYGILTRLMRDIGFDFYWNDLYTTNLLARGFEYSGGKERFELLTCFETFEHFTDPLSEIEKMFGLCENILFSTLLLPQPVPQPKNWWYFGLEHGQHISFFSLQTLEFIAKKFNCRLCSNGVDLHLFSKRKLNPTVFYLLTKLSSRGLSFFVEKSMKSRTNSDNNLLVDKFKAKSRV